MHRKMPKNKSIVTDTTLFGHTAIPKDAEVILPYFKITINVKKLIFMKFEVIFFIKFYNHIGT